MCRSRRFVANTCRKVLDDRPPGGDDGGGRRRELVVGCGGPGSTISSITLLSAFAVTDLAALQERTVCIGYREGLEILKALLQSKTVLTDVFLGNKGWNSSGGG